MIDNRLVPPTPFVPHHHDKQKLNASEQRQQDRWDAAHKVEPVALADRDKAIYKIEAKAKVDTLAIRDKALLDASNVEGQAHYEVAVVQHAAAVDQVNAEVAKKK